MSQIGENIVRIKWLHLSDIHFNFKNFDSHSLREDFLDRINNLSQTEPFTHLFLTGDILFQNNQADTETVAFIKGLIDTMHLPLENVILVPGNHDHNRQIAIEQFSSLCNLSDVMIDDLDENQRTSLLKAFDKFDAVYSKIFGSSYYSNLDNPHQVFCSSLISVVKLNTAWLDVGSSNTQSLRIGSRLLQLLLSSVDKDLRKSVNIAVGHHPLDELTTSERARILGLFQKNNIGIYFCGHMHRADIKIYRDHDIIEIIAPGGYVDNEGYSVGGYVVGIIDTDANFYKAEVYSWKSGKWCIDSTIAETNDQGIFYFNTAHFPNNVDIVAVDCKTIGGHISKKQLEQSLGIKNFDTYTYCGPYGCPTGFSTDTIQDFSNTILHLSESGKTVHLYPLAPIPMLLSLGFNLQKNATLIIHQYDRNAEKWIYNERSDHISISCKTSFSNNNILAVSISTSFNIEMDLISNAMSGRSYDLLEFTTDRIEIGYPLYNDDLHSAVKTITDILNSLASKYTEIHLFAAIPAGVAVELGRNMLTSVYRNVYTYQLTHGEYVQDLVLNKTSYPKVSKAIPAAISLETSNIIYIPILGRVPCGSAKEALVDSDAYLPLPKSILDNGDYYILVASGDSMIGAGIENGDYVLVKQQTTAREGEIVVALIDGCTTLKRLHFDKYSKKIILYPENSEYEPSSYEKIEIQGIAVKVFKDLQ